MIDDNLTYLKFAVHLKDEYDNNVDHVSIFAEQRLKLHENLCSLKKDGSFADNFFAYARFGSFRHIPLEIQPSFPLLTLKHAISAYEYSSLSVFFAINSGDFSFLRILKLIMFPLHMMFLH